MCVSLCEREKPRERERERERESVSVCVCVLVLKLVARVLQPIIIDFELRECHLCV